MKMIKKRVVNYILIIFCMILISCGGSVSKQVSTDLIKNPNTANGKTNTDKLPKFEFKEELHDFGKVIEGEKVSFSFRFRNVGGSDLLIFKATASCGCTVADYPKKPIQPGEESTIEISFNTEGKKGIQNKTVTVMSNTQPNTKVLTIKAEVISPETK